MILSGGEAERLTREGVAALRRGDARAAYAALRAVADGGADAGVRVPWFLIAQAARMLGDAAAETAALDRFLGEEPRHLAALLMMAERQAAAGDDRAGMSFYRTALAVAAQPGTTVPPALVSMLHAGEAFVAAASARFAAHLEACVAGIEGATGRSRDGARVRQAIDLLLGRTELYPQQPSMFYFPGLPQRQYFDSAEFAWAPAVEAATDAIRGELDALLAREGAAFRPYVTAQEGRPAPSNPLLNDPSWGAYYLWENGVPVAQAALACPETMAALAQAPIPAIRARSPMALFSLLRPGTHIAPHHGLLNTRLICHLPIVVPPDCALRVGNETRAWVPGRLTIFDDSIEHEAWNRSGDTRVVLLFEVWRPELTEVERAGLATIFEAIDGYSGAAFDAG